MLSAAEVRAILEHSDEIFSAAEVDRALHRVAGEIHARLEDRYPLLLSVMGGAVVFTGQLLPLLPFPLDFDTIHAARYGDKILGGPLVWKLKPRENVAGRTVLIVDDILDEGHTLATIRDMVLQLGATEVFSCVFVDKQLGRAKPISADFVGLQAPNRFMFGFGMDVRGAWRNLPAIYAVKEEV
jgi:hypoxanthine phosphoribosyltransferase